ncbi:MAG: TIGR02281 family clan AA aspartic protease [Croceibacterium sp.]
MKGAWVIVGLTCLGVALTAPNLRAGKPAAEARLARAGPWSKNSAAALATSHWNAGETTLAREGDGHFYAEVSANGAQTRMLVDTGASVVALTGEDAEAMGIRWSPADVKPIGQGASGVVYGLETRLDSVRLGGIEVHGVQAIVVPEGLGVSLLGQSFLRRLDHVEMSDDKMVLGG